MPLTFGVGYISNMTVYGYKEKFEEEEIAIYSTNDSYKNTTIESIRNGKKYFQGMQFI